MFGYQLPSKTDVWNIGLLFWKCPWLRFRMLYHVVVMVCLRSPEEMYVNFFKYVGPYPKFVWRIVVEVKRFSETLTPIYTNADVSCTEDLQLIYEEF